MLHIKNMVCNRCITVVKQELEKLGITVQHIRLGEVSVAMPDPPVDHKVIQKVLQANGFELLDDKKIKTIEKIKNVVVALIHHAPESVPHVNYSTAIADQVGLDYHYLSTLFSSTEGITIERYIILQRLEKVKELIVYDELSLSEIAYKAGYSSVQHLSNQFKKITGFTPTYFKRHHLGNRKPLDQIGS